jgi:hypothetical protein
MYVKNILTLICPMRKKKLGVDQQSHFCAREIAEGGYRQIKDDCGKIKVKFMVTVLHGLKRLQFMILEKRK